MTIREFINYNRTTWIKTQHSKIKRKYLVNYQKGEAWTTEQEPATRKTAKTKSIELTDEVLAELKNKKPLF